ncbi:MAG TPA: universal stress protein [Gaiellaceae bacterium]|nr:universal stress protein [Gaiellaceae bacterium]
MSSAESEAGGQSAPRRRGRREQRLERVLGAPALFATVYGNVGSSIYYALGVTAVFALGLTPLVFLIAGIIFAATTLTYAEGTVRYPEAGGSSSFARHAFNELVSFGAAWAQMLNYIITISISAFFVPHYLSIFWEPLRTNPWDILGGAIVIVILVGLNIVGIREAAGLNIFLAVIDFATQLLLVLLGLFLVLSPGILVDNVHFGSAPTWGDFFLAIPVGMIAYTGIETVSNLAEEARDPARNVPRAYLMTAIAVFAIFFTLPSIALSALPVKEVGGDFKTLLGLPPDEGGFANDPVLGVVDNLGVSGVLLDVLRIYVGILAATILFIATNAGVIGASRITYAMSGYRQLPGVFRRLHPTFKTPWIALVVFAGLISILTLLPGKVDFLGTMYSFGAMLSFAIAHLSVIALRYRRRDEELVFRGRPNLRLGGVDWPLFAFVGALATGLAWIVVVWQTPNTRYAGLAWMAIGFIAYAVYRRRVLDVGLLETVRAPVVVLGPALTVEYRTIVVPVLRTTESEEALVAAARLAAERGATIAVVTVVEVPMDLPLDADLGDLEAEAEQVLDEAQAFLEQYGVRAVTRLKRARSAGRAIVEEVESRNAELVVLGAPRAKLPGGGPIFGRTVDYVLRHSPSRVLVAAGKRAA